MKDKMLHLRAPGKPHPQVVCVTCRTVNAPPCEHERVTVGPRWRAPKKSNARAWKRIEAGEWLWDRNAIERAAKGGWWSPWRMSPYERRQEILASQERCAQREALREGRHG